MASDDSLRGGIYADSVEGAGAGGSILYLASEGCLPFGATREVQCELEKSLTGSTSHPWMWQLSLQ